MKKNIMKKVLSQIQSHPKITIGLIGAGIYFPLWLFSIYIHFKQVLTGVVAVPILGSDSIEYWNLALNLKQGVFSLDPGHVYEIFRVPGYPFFVYLIISIFKTIFAVTLIQIILTLLTAYLIYKIINLKFDSKYAIWGPIVFLLEPSVILHSLIILSDCSYVFLLLLSTYFLLKKSNNSVFLTGIILGVSVLFRPISMFLPAIYLCWYLYEFWGEYKLFLQKFLIFWLGFLIAICPWIYRNYHIYKTISVSNITSYNFVYYNIPMYVSWKTGLSEERARQELFARYGINEKSLRYEVVSASSTLAIKSTLKKDFISYLFFHIKKTESFFFGSSIKIVLLVYYNLVLNTVTVNYGGIWKMLIILERLLWLIVFTLSAFALLDKKNRTFVLLCLVMIVYFAILTGPVSYARYRLPAEPYACIVLPIVVSVLVSRYKNAIYK